jgi:hypothetical protein
LFWIVKLVVFGVLLYSAFWLALLLAFALITAWLVRDADPDEEKQPELRDGHSSVGLYDCLESAGARRVYILRCITHTIGTFSDSREGSDAISPRHLAFTALCRPTNV